MARTDNTLKNTGIAAAVVAAAFGIGYFVLGGPRSAPAPTDPLPISTAAPASVAAPRTAAIGDPHISPRTKNSDYTSPNAPRIRIVEERTPSLTLSRRPAVLQPPADASVAQSGDGEASQVAAATDTSASGTTAASGGAGSTAAGAGSETGSGTSAPLIPPAAVPTTTGGTPDQDFEQIGGRGGAEAGQDGAASSGGKAQFRVQTGSFAAQQNARTLAEALRSRGYTTSTRAEQEDGKIVYKVQIGAYRNRAAADKAAQDLQKSGYPAYSSPISP